MRHFLGTASVNLHHEPCVSFVAVHVHCPSTCSLLQQPSRVQCSVQVNLAPVISCVHLIPKFASLHVLRVHLPGAAEPHLRSPIALVSSVRLPDPASLRALQQQVCAALLGGSDAHSIL